MLAGLLGKPLPLSQTNRGAGCETSLLPAVPPLQILVDPLAPGPLRQKTEHGFEYAEESRHPSLAPLEQESRVVEVLRQPFGVRVAVRSEAVSYPKRFLETAVARPEFDQESSRPVGGVVEVVQRVLRRDGLLSRGQGAGFSVDHHLQRARDHLEVFGVGQVVVRRRPPPGATSISMRVCSPPDSSLVSRK